MAKGQKHGNREAKKPKTAVKKTNASAPTTLTQLSARPAPSKAGKA